MSEATIELSAYFNIGVIVTCFLVGFIIKNYTKAPNNYIPLIMVLTGIVANVTISINNGTTVNMDTILSGGISGLASSGSYDLIFKSLGLKKLDNTNNSSQLNNNDSNSPPVG